MTANFVREKLIIVIIYAPLQGRPDYENEAFFEEVYIGIVNNKNDKEIKEMGDHQESDM